MKLYCKGEYHNSPAGLHFSREGVIEIDDAKGEFLLRDAPENFSRELPAPEPAAGMSAEMKAPDAPAKDKMVKEPGKKKER